MGEELQRGPANARAGPVWHIPRVGRGPRRTPSTVALLIVDRRPVPQPHDRRQMGASVVKHAVVFVPNGSATHLVPFFFPISKKGNRAVRWIVVASILGRRLRSRCYVPPDTKRPVTACRPGTSSKLVGPHPPLMRTIDSGPTCCGPHHVCLGYPATRRLATWIGSRAEVLNWVARSSFPGRTPTIQRLARFLKAMSRKSAMVAMAALKRRCSRFLGGWARGAKRQARRSTETIKHRPPGHVSFTRHDLRPDNIEHRPLAKADRVRYRCCWRIRRIRKAAVWANAKRSAFTALTSIKRTAVSWRRITLLSRARAGQSRWRSDRLGAVRRSRHADREPSVPPRVVAGGAVG